MNLAQIQASRKLWRGREVSRYRRWHAAKSRADRARYYKLYVEARDARRHRDTQISKARKEANKGVPLSAVKLVASFEGFSSTVYHDAVGVATIGYGETRKDIVARGRISRVEALRLLLTRLNRDYLPAVRAADAHHKLTAKGEGGFTSFVYNVGVGGVASSTGVGRALRAGNIVAAANGLLAWNKAGGRVLAGLDRRRHAERAYIL